MPRPAIAIAAVCALTLCACGKSAPTDRQQVRATLTRLQTAVSQHDYALICDDVLAARLVRRLESFGLSCELALRKGLESRSDLRLQVRRIRLDRSSAFALVRSSAAGERPSTDTIELVKERRGWRVTSLAGPQPPAPRRPSAPTP